MRRKLVSFVGEAAGKMFASEACGDALRAKRQIMACADESELISILHRFFLLCSSTLGLQIPHHTILPPQFSLAGVYAVMPPLERFLGVSSSTRRAHFFKVTWPCIDVFFSSEEHLLYFLNCKALQ
jgi:hypothetical protein